MRAHGASVSMFCARVATAAGARRFQLHTLRLSRVFQVPVLSETTETCTRAKLVVKL
jgi:hypothetical protein